MMPGPPPVAITFCRGPLWSMLGAALAREQMRANSRAASYQPEPSPSLTRAEPKTTTVVATPQLPQVFLGLLVFELEAQAAGGVAQQEIHVHGRQPVGGAAIWALFDAVTMREFSLQGGVSGIGP